MGVGVTPVEIELGDTARRRRALAREGAAHRDGKEATFHALRLRA